MIRPAIHPTRNLVTAWKTKDAQNSSIMDAWEITIIMMKWLNAKQKTVSFTTREETQHILWSLIFSRGFIHLVLYKILSACAYQEGKKYVRKRYAGNLVYNLQGNSDIRALFRECPKSGCSRTY